MQNYGKNPSEDYSVVSGKVITAAPGTTLYKLPAYEQRNVNHKLLQNNKFKWN